MKHLTNIIIIGSLLMLTSCSGVQPKESGTIDLPAEIFGPINTPYYKIYIEGHEYIMIGSGRRRVMSHSGTCKAKHN